MDQEAIARHNVLEIMLLDENAEPKELPLSLLEDITNGFSDYQRIGKGRFAVVYKGMLENGTVAVKKLSSTYTNEEIFYQEVEFLMKMKHKNVLRFLGYCADVQERLLCFEYLPKGSLDGYITGPAFNGFEWRICCELIKGISKGLNYLHRNNIIHSDLKPSNILLDGNMVPKIADFQITRCYDEIQVEAVTSKLNGSVGYFAPELYMGRITTKSNIYSLGLVTREIMVGEKQSLNREEDLGKWKNMLDKMEGEAHFGQVLVYDKISQECIDFNPAKRPDTQHILDRLDGTSSSDSLSVGQAEESCSIELQEGISMVPDEMSYKVREILGVVVVPIYNELLGVNPLELRFPFQPNKSILCSLQLTNNIDDQVPFRLMEKDSELSGYFPALPMYDIMPRRSTRTFILEMRTPEKRTEETEFYLILQSNLCKPAVYTFLQDSMLRDMFFDKTNSPGDSMHEVTLKAVLAPQGEITTQSNYKN